MRAFLRSDCGTLFAPGSALFNASAVISLFGVIGKLVEQFTGKAVTLPTVFLTFALTAGFYGAAVAPKWLAHMYTARAIHLFAVGTLRA